MLLDLARPRPTLALLALVVALGSACKRGDSAGTAHSSATAQTSSAPAPPLDRLAPGELAPGKSHVFGFAVPEQMEVVSHSPERALLEGEVEGHALLDYVRERVVVAHVEMGAGRTIFPKARIKEGPPDRVYQLDVIPKRRRSTLIIEDVTPKPQPRENVSQEERWRRAGRAPDGKPLGIEQLK